MEEENSCWCAREGGAEAEAEAGAGLRCQKTHLLQLQKERHQRRMAQFVAAALLLLLCGILAVFLTFRLEKPCGSAPDSPTPAELVTQSSALAEKLVQTKSPVEHPSAMLTAPDGNNTRGKYLLWQHEFGEVHIQGGFNYCDGSLIVPKDGLYRVFLQTTYEIGIDECPDNNGPLIVSNKVYVFSNSYPEDRILLSAVDTVACSHGVWTKSLFSSGLFKLLGNDKLHVNSSHPKYMVKNEHQVFFGAELVFD